MLRSRNPPRAGRGGSVADLECDHCGDVAIESPTGLFGDGDGGKCTTCGFPGVVSIDDAGDDATAWWNTSQEPGARCDLADCEECRG